MGENKGTKNIKKKPKDRGEPITKEKHKSRVRRD
jgi:hypothetical protein